jgi:hypothetical protein
VHDSALGARLSAFGVDCGGMTLRSLRDLKRGQVMAGQEAINACEQ